MKRPNIISTFRGGQCPLQWPSLQEQGVFVLSLLLEDTARYAGLLLAPDINIVILDRCISKHTEHPVFTLVRILRNIALGSVQWISALPERGILRINSSSITLHLRTIQWFITMSLEQNNGSFNLLSLPTFITLSYSLFFVLTGESMVGHHLARCNPGPLPNGSLGRQVWHPPISLVGEVVSTTALECWRLPLCGSDTILFGLSKSSHLNRKQGHYDPAAVWLWTQVGRRTPWGSTLDCIVIGLNRMNPDRTSCLNCLWMA